MGREMGVFIVRGGHGGCGPNWAIRGPSPASPVLGMYVLPTICTAQAIFKDTALRE